MSALYRCGKVLVIPFYKLLFRYRILNKNSVPPGQKVILCSNHTSLNDPVFLALSQKPQIHFMAKVELFHNKLFAWLIRSLGAFPVTRGAGDNNAVDISLQLLNENRMLGIFPEGTRSKDGNLLKPKPGVAMFAHQAQAPVLPVAVVGKGGRVRLFHKVIVNCGELIPPEALGIAEGSGVEYRRASRYIMEKISSLREEALAMME